MVPAWKIQQKLLERANNRKMITNIEVHRQKYDLWCGKSRVEASVELGSLPTLRHV